MELLAALAVGIIIGYLAGRGSVRRMPTGDGENERRSRYKPTKRQEKILATLPADPERPSIEQLAAVEAAELGIDRLPGAVGIPPQVLLPVWRRDRPAHEGCAMDGLGFVIDPGVTPADASPDDVHLTCVDHPQVES